MTHAVLITAIGFYKAYVDDENNDKTTEQILAEAKEKFLNNDCVMDDVEPEEQDIQSIDYGYSF